MHIRTVVVAALLLTGCRSTEPPSIAANAVDPAMSGDLDRRCDELGGTGATAVFFADATCADCTGTGAQRSVDATDGTWAELATRAAGSGPMGLRAAAPAGVVFPAGSKAAVTLSIAEGSGYSVPGATVNPKNRQEWHVTIRTYREGVLQDQDDGTISIDENTDTYRAIVGTDTTQPFDAMEVAFDREPPEDPAGNVSGAPEFTQPGSVRVHEFCGDFELDGLD